MSQYLSLEPDLTLDDLDLDGVLNDIPDFEGTNKTDEFDEPTSPLNITNNMNIDNNILSLKSENFILAQKIETLKNMVTEYTTKFKEVELRLQHEYNLKEQQYINKIEQLQYQIKNQKTKLNGFQNLIRQQTNHEHKQNVSETNNEYTQQNKNFLHQIKRQNHQLDLLQNENIEIKGINEHYEAKIREQLAHIDNLKQSLHSMKYIRTESTQTTIQLRDKSSNTGLTKSSSGAISRSQPSRYSSLDPTAKLYDHEFNNANPSLLGLGLHGSTETVFDICNDGNAEEKTRETSRILTIPLTNIHESKSMNILHQHVQYRTHRGKLVLKQIPYTPQSHICVNVAVEFVGLNMEYVMMYIDKIYSVKQLIELLASSESMYHILTNRVVYVYAANDDGELEDNAKALGQGQRIAEMGIINFYVKILNGDDGNDAFDTDAYKKLNTINSISASEKSTNMNEVSNAPICDNNCVIV